MASDDNPKNGWLYDDMGNLIQAPGGAPFVNENGNIEVRKALDPSRVVERNAGCWSCIHYDNGQLYDAKVEASYICDVAAFKTIGLPEHQALSLANKNRKTLVARKGILGVCAAGKTEEDFVVARYLCHYWSGKTGAALARGPGEALSPLIGEVIDQLPPAPPAPPPANPEEGDGE